MVVRILKGKSVRYQKAFNLNYHESKRHQDELAFLEITCSRNIHVIKQDIMRVKGWMDDVVKSTGHHVSHEIDKLTLSPPPSRQSSVNFSKVGLFFETLLLFICSSYTHFVRAHRQVLKNTPSNLIRSETLSFECNIKVLLVFIILLFITSLVII